MDNDVIFITNENRYFVDAIINLGFIHFKPYIGEGFVLRNLRKICFKYHILEKFWYNKEILKFKPKVIVFYEALMTMNYIKWVNNNLNNAKIIINFVNLVDYAKNITIKLLPSNIELWTYDKSDSEKYNLKLHQYSGLYLDNFMFKCTKIYDVTYVGRDKGRAEKILKLANELKTLGLKTNIKIMADNRFNYFFRHKSYYSKIIDYYEVLKLEKSSKAIINIILPGQTSATMRDYEAMFFKIKLITNNQNIVHYDFYCKENIFILGKDDMNNLVNFINKPYKTLSSEILEKYKFGDYIYEMLN